MPLKLITWRIPKWGRWADGTVPTPLSHMPWFACTGILTLESRVLSQKQPQCKLNAFANTARRAVRGGCLFAARGPCRCVCSCRCLCPKTPVALVLLSLRRSIAWAQSCACLPGEMQWLQGWLLSFPKCQFSLQHCCIASFNSFR